MPETPLLETARLRLRPWRAEDAEELYRYASDPLVGPNAGWLPHQSLQESRDILSTVLAGPLDFAVEWKETGKPIGAISLRLYRYGDTSLAPGEGEIGFWLGVPYWGRGIIPEATRKVLAYAFTQAGLNRVWCSYYLGNERSRRVQEKCGFLHHHTEAPKQTAVGVRQKVTQSMTREQWAALYPGEER